MIHTKIRCDRCSNVANTHEARAQGFRRVKVRKFDEANKKTTEMDQYELCGECFDNMWEGVKGFPEITDERRQKQEQEEKDDEKDRV